MYGSSPRTFTVTEDHIKLLGRMYFTYDDWTEFGAPEVNPKRPYGNSDVVDDIAEILGWELVTDRYGEQVVTEEQADEAKKLHEEMTTVLQILVQHPLDFQVTTYQRKNYSDWVLAD